MTIHIELEKQDIETKRNIAQFPSKIFGKLLDITKNLIYLVYSSKG